MYLSNFKTVNTPFHFIPKINKLFIKKLLERIKAFLNARLEKTNNRHEVKKPLKACSNG